jgi:hypothetical protein
MVWQFRITTIITIQELRKIDDTSKIQPILNLEGLFAFLYYNSLKSQIRNEKNV